MRSGKYLRSSNWGGFSILLTFLPNQVDSLRNIPDSLFDGFVNGRNTRVKMFTKRLGIFFLKQELFLSC